MKTSHEIKAQHPLPWAVKKAVIKDTWPRREVGEGENFDYFRVEDAKGVTVTVFYKNQEWLANVVIAGSQALLTKEAFQQTVRPFRGPNTGATDGPEAA